MNIKKNIHILLKGIKGQGMIEFIILVSLIAIGGMAGFLLLQKTCTSKNTEMALTIKTLDTGKNNGTGTNTQQKILTDEERKNIQSDIKELRGEATRLSGLANLQALAGLEDAADFNSKTANLLNIEAARLEALLKNDPSIIRLEIAKIGASETVQETIDILFENVPLPPQVKKVADWVKLPIQDGCGQLAEILIEYTFN